MADIVDDSDKAIEANKAYCISKITGRAPESNDSGFCLICDEEISEVRLLYQPKANNCLHCQNALEYRNKQAKRF